ncbi:hypothetical protein ACIU4M_00600 [Bacillus altitudinis]
MTRAEKITFIIESIWEFEGVHVSDQYFAEHTNDQLDKEYEKWEYLWEK